jgi:hypothetical protein
LHQERDSRARDLSPASPSRSVCCRCCVINPNPASRSKGLQPTRRWNPGERVPPLKHRAAPGLRAPHPSSCPSSVRFAESAAPQPPRWPHGEVSFLPVSGCMLRAEKAVETRGGPIIATRLLLRPDTLRHDAGSQREANHDGQGHPQFCRRLQHSGTVGMPCMKTWMAVTLRSAMTLFDAAVVVLVRLKGY